LGEEVLRSRVDGEYGLERRQTFGERASVENGRGTWNLERSREYFGTQTRGQIQKRNVVS